MTTTTPPATPRALLFGPFRLEIDEARLSEAGRVVELRPKAFELLAALASRPGTLLTKEALLDTVWGRRFITEGVVKSIVAELRQTLGDDPKTPRWIETVPRRGYRFIGRVQADPTTVAVAPEPGPEPEPEPTPEPEPANHAAASPAAPARPHPGAAADGGNLPRPATALVGRERVLDELGAMLCHPLVTVVGPSGVGKTRVALALADAQRLQRRDGAWLIELAALAPEAASTATLCAMIARALRLDAGTGADPLALARSLRPLDAVLVLDNAEHLLEVLAPLVASLFDTDAAVRFVVTSQEPLRIDGEHVFRLAPLALPAPADDADPARLMASGAVRLFVERAAARLHGFALAPGQQRAVAAICRALDGVPLALELAAARLPVLGVHGIAELLLAGGGNGGDTSHHETSGADARFELLTGGARSALPRQRTLRDAIAWSHGLLDDPQQRVFRRLGVFRGSFELAAAEAVCADPGLARWAVVDAIGALVDKSLLERLERPDAPRFRLLESPRAFALERLAASADATAARDRHLEVAVARWRAADDRSLAEPSLVGLERQLPEIDDLRAALRRAQHTGATDALATLAAASALFWFRAGLAAEGRHWCEAAKAALAALPQRPAAGESLDVARATLALYANVYATADVLPSAERAAAAFEGRDPARAYFALYLVLQLRMRLQTPFDRDAAMARMARLERPEWGELMRRFLRHLRGYELRLGGDVAGYLAFCRHELALCSRLGAVAESWSAAQGLMLAELDGGDVAAALAVGRHALAEIRAAGHLRQHTVFLALWLTLLAEHGALDDLRQAAAEALPLLQASGSPWMLHIALAWIACRDGRPADAARVLGWHAAQRAAGRALPPGQAIARSMRALESRLADELGGAALADGQAAGSTLGEDAANEAGLPSRNT